MLDHFDEKRGMVQKLLAMLKSHAANEVSTGLKRPEGEGDMRGLEVSHVEVLPDHKMDEVTPEHDIREEENQPAPDEMNTGGMVPDSSEGQPEIKGAAHEEATESEAEREAEGDIAPVSLFSNFLGKKKRK